MAFLAQRLFSPFWMPSKFMGNVLLFMFIPGNSAGDSSTYGSQICGHSFLAQQMHSALHMQTAEAEGVRLQHIWQTQRPHSPFLKMGSNIHAVSLSVFTKTKHCENNYCYGNIDALQTLKKNHNTNLFLV